MRLLRSKSALAAIALALLATLGLAFVEDGFVHTDDGCAVETHCLSCRFALSATVVAPASLTVAPVLAPSGSVAAPPLLGSSDPCPRASLSRGPPARSSALS